jgi:hypothetical protein
LPPRRGNILQLSEEFIEIHKAGTLKRLSTGTYVELNCLVNESLVEIWTFTDAELTTNLQFDSASIIERADTTNDWELASGFQRNGRTKRHGTAQSHNATDPTGS